MRALTLSLIMAGLAVGAVSTDASAQTKKHHVYSYDTSGLQSLPLTVNRRSWLDPGPVAPKGTGANYVAASTEFNTTQDRIINPDKFGNDVMVGQPYVPGRTVPVVEFATTPAGGVEVANTIGYQNYYFNPAPSEP